MGRQVVRPAETPRIGATLVPPRGRSARALLWPLGALAGLALLLLAQRAALALPATATSPLVPLARLFDLALLALALALGHAAGARALRAPGLRVQPVDGAAFGMALGLGLWAYAALALGLDRKSVVEGKGADDG